MTLNRRTGSGSDLAVSVHSTGNIRLNRGTGSGSNLAGSTHSTGVWGRI